MAVPFASESKYNDIQPISTGLASFDKITGIGGIPRKRITEIFGEAGLGKSTLCLQLVAEAQKNGLKCLWADAEWTYSPLYSSELGVNNDKLGLLQETYAEAILDTLEAEIQSGKWDLVILDSIGGLLPRAEAEKGADGKVIGGQAKLIATFCRKIVPLLVIKDVALVVINHSFTDIMSGRIKTSGGMKLEYHKSQSFRLKRGNKRLMQGENHIGDIVIAEVMKNKVSATLKQSTELTLIYGEGFAKGADLMQEALDKNVIEKRGNTFFLREEKLVTGLSKLRELFKDVEFANKIKELV